MDLFDYAQALFNEEGHLWLPALGHFAKVRKSSYYDADIGRMHPPRYQVGFQQKLDNTDTAFIAYFSKAKNLSQGSAKYFVDKFVENIKEELQQREVTFASLGTLYTGADAQIAFRGNDLNSLGEGGLFGLAPIRINRLEPAPEPEEDKPAEETPANTETEIAQADQAEIPADVLSNDSASESETNSDAPATDNSTEEPAINDTTPQKRTYDPNNFYTDDRVLVLKGKPRHEDKSKKYQFWISAVVIGIAVILGIYMITQSMIDPANNTEVSGQVSNKDNGKKDTTINLSKAKNDSQLVHAQDIKTLPAAVDTGLPKPAATTLPEPVKPQLGPVTAIQIPKDSWLVSGGQNNNYDAAMRTLNKFRAMGYAEARMIDSVKRKEYFVYKIIFGYYSTQKEAAQARILILKENKLKPKVLKVQQYK